MVVAIINLGAEVLQIIVLDRSGKLEDVALGYDKLADVITGSPSTGAFADRCAGRIGGARFTLDGREHRLTPDSGPHCIHGGPPGSRHRAFPAEQIDAQTLLLQHRFVTSGGNFPGTLDLQLTYRLSEDNALAIEHVATALDEPGPASFTSHIYFNLDGVDQGQRINGHRLEVPSSILPPHPAQTLRRCARLCSETSGRTLDVWTAEPCCRCTPLASSARRNGTPRPQQMRVRHRPRAAICLEPQQFPNAPNCPSLPQNNVTPGTPYRATTVYRFGIVKTSS